MTKKQTGKRFSTLNSQSRKSYVRKNTANIKLDKIKVDKSAISNNLNSKEQAKLLPLPVKKGKIRDINTEKRFTTSQPIETKSDKEAQSIKTKQNEQTFIQSIPEHETTIDCSDFTGINPGIIFFIPILIVISKILQPWAKTAATKSRTRANVLWALTNLKRDIENDNHKNELKPAIYRWTNTISLTIC